MGQRDEKDKIKSRKEKLAGYFYDLSKLTFAALVLGGKYNDICHRHCVYLCICFLGKSNFKVLKL